MDGAPISRVGGPIGSRPPSPAADADASTSTTTASPSAQPEEEKITLLSSDGEAFEVSVAVALQSGILKQAIEDDCVAGGVPIPNAPSRLLSMVLEHMNAKHGLEPADFAKFEAEFVGNLDKAALFEVIVAANYLDTKALLDAACQRVANMMSKMTPEEIREEFGIVNDFTPEEEAAVREEVTWAFD